MSSSLQLSNEELVRLALNTMGLGRSVSGVSDAIEGDLRAVLRDGLRRALFPTVNGEPYQWRWRERYHAIPVVAKYTTGTITIANGTITQTGGTWPSWAADGLILVGGNIVFVSTREDDNDLTTDNTELSVTDATFELHRYKYALPTDFAEWIGGVVYASESDNWMLGGASEAELRLRYAIGWTNNERTSHYAITAAPTGVFQIMLWPVPVPDSYVRGTYLSVPDDNLPDDLRSPGATPIIQCPPAYARLFTEAVLAAAEAFNDDAIGIHEQRYQQALIDCVAHDRAANGPWDFTTHLGRARVNQNLPTSIDFTTQL